MEKQMKREIDNEFFTEFPGEDRLDYPDTIVRVTGGAGGEALLILGSEKTALYDTGMACFADNLIYNISLVLDEEKRTLDYILMSHTHYDHIGALPYVLKKWSDAVVCGHEKASRVFRSERALKTMEELGNAAKKTYHRENAEITAQGMRIDRILRDGDEISLGDVTVKAYETPGHTDCSMSYMVLPEKILISVESTGLLRGPGRISTAPLKSIDESIASAKRLKNMDYECLIIPHYGVCPYNYRYDFFDDYIKEQLEEKKLIEDGIARGLTEDEILEEHKKRYWTAERAKAQPYEAYKLNTEIVIRQLMNR